MKKLTGFLQKAENVVYGGVAVILSGASLAVFYMAVSGFIGNITAGEILAGTLRLIEDLLILLIMAGLIHTITITLKSGKLRPEPYLIVGVIACVRRLITLTVEASHWLASDIEKFKFILLEAVALGVLVFILIAAFLYMRRARHMEGEQEDRE